MTTLAEPEFLSKRRAAAVAEADGLDLPVFKGEAGWEFTPLKGFDVAAYPAAPGGAEDAAEHVLDLDLDAAVRVSADEAVSEGPVVLPLAVAAERHPDIVERYLGTVVRQRSRLTVENDARWSDGAFVYVPRGVHEIGRASCRERV